MGIKCVTMTINKGQASLIPIQRGVFFATASSLESSKLIGTLTAYGEVATIQDKATYLKVGDIPNKLCIFYEDKGLGGYVVKDNRNIENTHRIDFLFFT